MYAWGCNGCIFCRPLLLTSAVIFCCGLLVLIEPVPLFCPCLHNHGERRGPQPTFCLQCLQTYTRRQRQKSDSAALDDSLLFCLCLCHSVNVLPHHVPHSKLSVGVAVWRRRCRACRSPLGSARRTPSHYPGTLWSFSLSLDLQRVFLSLPRPLPLPTHPLDHSLLVPSTPTNLVCGSLGLW